MKLEIDISSILYNDAKENRNYISLNKLEIAWKAIADGKPLEQEPTTKNNLGVDCISRTRAIERLKLNFPISQGADNSRDRHRYMQTMADIQAIREIPSVTPQLSSELDKNSQKLEKDFGELDCVSRADVKAKKIYSHERHEYVVPIAEIDWLPSVTPQLRKGHWIMTGDYYTGAYGTIDYVECSCCHEYSLEEGNYCPHCGAKMVEPQESEEE